MKRQRRVIPVRRSAVSAGVLMLGTPILLAGFAESFVNSATSTLPQSSVLASDSKLVPDKHEGTFTSTSLRMAWLIPAAPNANLNAFGTWYEERDPRAGPPIYDDCESDYSFSAPAANWPSMEVSLPEETSDAPLVTSREFRRPRPVQAIRRAAGWAIGNLPQLVAKSF